jgi:hypothetical protein
VVPALENERGRQKKTTISQQKSGGCKTMWRKLWWMAMGGGGGSGSRGWGAMPKAVGGIWGWLQKPLSFYADRRWKTLTMAAAVVYVKKLQSAWRGGGVDVQRWWRQQMQGRQRMLEEKKKARWQQDDDNNTKMTRWQWQKEDNDDDDNKDDNEDEDNDNKRTMMRRQLMTRWQWMMRRQRSARWQSTKRQWRDKDEDDEMKTTRRWKAAPNGDTDPQRQQAADPQQLVKK